MMQSMMGGAAGQNTFLIGGFVLVIVQSLSRILEQAAGLVATYIFRLVFVTIDVDNSQDTHTWITSYLSHLHSQGKVMTWGTLTVLNDLRSRKLDTNYGGPNGKVHICFQFSISDFLI